MTWTTYKEKIRRLSQRVVDAQKPIRVLDAIKWDPSIEAELKRSKFKHMPKVGPDYYAKTELGFDPIKKTDELKDLIQDIETSLGSDDALGVLLKKITTSYKCYSRAGLAIFGLTVKNSTARPKIASTKKTRFIAWDKLSIPF